jgi:hypothetical protein
MPITVKNHEGLHDSVLRATLASATAALGGLFLPAGFAPALAVALVGAAVVAPDTIRSAALILACAGVTGVGARLGVAGPVAAAAFGVVLAQKRTGLWAGAASLLGALGGLTAFLVARALGQTELLGFLPPGLETLAVGALSGAVMGVSSIGRHLAPLEQPAPDELLAVAAQGELGELLERASLAHREAVAALGLAAPEVRSAADDLVRRMARFGRRWHEVELEAARARPEVVRGRLTDLDARLLATSDPVARQELGRAREALQAQVDYLDEIARGRERAVARLSHQVATLERLRLQAVRHRSVDAARLGAELQPVADELAQAGGELDIEADALAEAHLGPALPAAPN